ncbi:MAG: hypothetical protein LCH81_16370 [Bacteroidetes bacterium]|nr:hypothetical protein [Bacteroidota bacterium]
MNSLSRFLDRIANWKTFAFFWASYLFFCGVILKNAENAINHLAGKTVGIIDLTFGFHPARTLQMVADYGDAARALYARTEMTADVAYPLVYAFLLGILLTFLYRKTAAAWLNVLPFVVLLFDYAENTSIVWLLYTFPQQSMTAALCCEVFKLLKWGTLGLSAMLIVWGGVGRLRYVDFRFSIT